MMVAILWGYIMQLNKSKINGSSMWFMPEELAKEIWKIKSNCYLSSKIGL